jgi:hypothetical protein
MFEVHGISKDGFTTETQPPGEKLKKTSGPEDKATPFAILYSISTASVAAV